MQFDVLEKEEVFRGFFRMYRYRLRHSLFAGGMSPEFTRELFERGHSAAVLPYDPVADAVVLVEQFRVGALEHSGSPWLFETVAGILEPGHSAEETVRREAREEADAELLDLEHICDYLVSPGGTSERVSLYCGRVDVDGLGGIHGVDDENEDIRVHVVSYDEAVDMLQNGLLNSAMPIIAMQWLMMHRERLQDLWD